LPPVVTVWRWAHHSPDRPGSSSRRDAQTVTTTPLADMKLTIG